MGKEVAQVPLAYTRVLYDTGPSVVVNWPRHGMNGQRQTLINKAHHLACMSVEQWGDLERGREPEDGPFAVLSATLIRDHDCDVAGADLLIEAGGPTVCIDTRTREVEASWDDDRATAELRQDVAEYLTRTIAAHYGES